MASSEMTSEKLIIERLSRAKLAYRVGGIKLPVLPNDINADVAAERVNRSPIKGKTITIDAAAGIQPTDLERAALTWLLAALCPQDSGRKQWRAVLPLAPPSAAVGQVILAYDAQLNGTATLVGRGYPLGGAAEDVSDEAVLRRLDTYKLSAVNGAWKAGELLKVSRALALLSDTESAALEGVVLERVKELPDSAQNGHTMAKFVSDFAPEIGEMGTIFVADKTFEDDVMGFYGGADGVPVRPPSFQSILHEVGHAVESAQRRATSRANAEYVLARAGRNETYTLRQTIPDDVILEAKGLTFSNIKAETAHENLAVRAFNAIGDKSADALILIQECRSKGGVMATLADRLGDYQAGKDSNPAEEQIELVRGEQKAITEVFKFIAGLLTTLNSDQPERLRPSNFVQVRDYLQGLDHEPWMAFHREVMRWCDVQERAATWRGEYKPGGKETTGRRKAFVTYANEKSISSDLTLYAQAEWPNNPDEFYCEAFGVWKVDPVGLRRHSADLATYFEEGTHLKGS